MTRMPLCSWCDITLSENLRINFPGNDKMKKSFCSEKCFELSRRASFKRGKTCDWCDKISATDSGIKSGSDYSSTSKTSNKSESVESVENGGIANVEQLHFCNSLCLNNYKKTVFEKETSDVLQVKKEESFGDIDIETVATPKLNDEKKCGIGTKSPSIKASKNVASISLKKSRCSSFTKLYKCNKRTFSADSNVAPQISNLSHHNINPMYHNFNSYGDLLNSRPSSSLSNFNLQNKTPESIKIPISGPLYIPVPIPIPIPIFKNAPEIIDILYKYGFRQTQNTKENINTSKSPIGTSSKPIPIPTITSSEPQTEALDLSGSSDIKNEASQNKLNVNTSFPITSILHLNDPYLKRRNRILDAPTPPTINGFNYSTRIKNYGLNYAEILSSSQIKSAKYSRKRIEKSPNFNKTSNIKSQSPRPLIQTTKSLLRRYPLISLRRNIKSAPSSVIDSNIK